MSNITIGIVAKDKLLEDNITCEVINKNNLKYIHNKCNYIGILNYDNDYIDTNLLKCCDGIIIPGGTNIYPYHFQIVDYCYKNNIPILGICMGHQIIGLYSINKTNEEDLITIKNHNDKNLLHNVKISKDSKLYSILGEDIKVNSRHYYALSKVGKPFIINMTSQDNIIEGIEYIDDNHFLLGVQFHPEDLDNMNSLYNYFIKEILIRKKGR